jgi:flagellar basal-body rod modification protein FlgD
MSTVTSTTSATAATGYATTDSTIRIPQQTLNQDDFLKLLVAQLSAQDPMNPQKDTEFISQMSQFSSLEQSKSMVTSLADLQTEQKRVQANGLLGRQVEIQTGKDTTVTGVVDSIQYQEGTPLIVVKGQAYDLSQVNSVTTAQQTTANK